MQLNCPSKRISSQFIINLQINENLFLSKLKLRFVYRTVIRSCASTAYRLNTLFPNGLLNPCNCQEEHRLKGQMIAHQPNFLFPQQSEGLLWSFCPSAIFQNELILRKLENVTLLMQFTLIMIYIRCDQLCSERNFFGDSHLLVSRLKDYSPMRIPNMLSFLQQFCSAHK